MRFIYLIAIAVAGAVLSCNLALAGDCCCKDKCCKPKCCEPKCCEPKCCEPCKCEEPKCDPQCLDMSACGHWAMDWRQGDCYTGKLLGSANWGEPCCSCKTKCGCGCGH